jgi:hypothetical protein
MARRGEGRAHQHISKRGLSGLQRLTRLLAPGAAEADKGSARCEYFELMIWLPYGKPHSRTR